LRIADRAARVHDGRAARAMNRAIDATTAQQAAIGRVDDGIDFHPGNIAVHDLQVFPCHGVSWSPGWGGHDMAPFSSIRRETAFRCGRSSRKRCVCARIA
jgi:hypothetical protein